MLYSTKNISQTAILMTTTKESRSKIGKTIYLSTDLVGTYLASIFNLNFITPKLLKKKLLKHKSISGICRRAKCWKIPYCIPDLPQLQIN